MSDKELEQEYDALEASSGDRVPLAPSQQQAATTDQSSVTLCTVRTSTVIGYLFVSAIVIAIFGLLPWGIVELRREKEETHVQAWFAAGIFVAVTIPITLWDVANHLRHWNNPRLQKHIVRVLLMAPIYALDSWLALRFPNANIYLDTARECYEAYVIYNFYAYLLTFLRQRPDFDDVVARRDNQPHIFPFCCLPTWEMGPSFINACTHGVTSYVVVRLLTTFAAFFSAMAGKYGDGDIAVDKAYVYLAGANCVSQAWAMYCLILLYYAFKKDLKPIHPVGKFLSIKAVIFFSFWQSVFIAILVVANVIKQDPTWTHYTQQSVAAGLQDFLICVEMFIASVVHHFVFSYREHLTQREDAADQRQSFFSRIKELLDIRDVAYTVIDHVHTVTTLDGRLSRSTASQPSSRWNEHTALLSASAPASVQRGKSSEGTEDGHQQSSGKSTRTTHGAVDL